jgi:hypothetical protein
MMDLSVVWFINRVELSGWEMVEVPATTFPSLGNAHAVFAQKIDITNIILNSDFIL